MNKKEADHGPVLVPGGAGFIGSHLCGCLLEQGHEVIALDNFSTGHAGHVAHLRRHARFRLIEHDLTRPLPALAARATRIFNLACPASPAYYQQHPVQTALSSALGVWRLLELVQTSGARLLQASTSEVYGDPQCHPQREDYHGHVNPVGPRACYDEGKRFAEALMISSLAERPLSLRIARLFNCYGPRLHEGDGRVVSNFIVQALRGEPITIHGDGMQTRSLCYVDDTVAGLLRLMDSAVEGPVNLGNPVEVTVLELADRVLSLTGSRSPLVYLPRQPDDPRRRRPDISRARAELDWRPGVSLDDGLRETVAYFRYRLDAGRRHFPMPVSSAA
ncbi:GDP-mannose 4,6-dehydratase [Uliginosibacterium paludis]|uniref:UDP-glucuronate decarboxylase n=1 Tax=Uliginosibacterium paludis TaxID=1615952 RepID=A0ABV2CTC6_9RHOO